MGDPLFNFFNSLFGGDDASAQFFSARQDAIGAEPSENINDGLGSNAQLALRATEAVARTSAAAATAASIEIAATTVVSEAVVGGAFALGVRSAINSVNPSSIRFSQSSVNGTADLVASMKKNGFKGDAIDVVRMSDGGLTTLDNTRVLAASRAGVNVKANIHNASDAIPASMAGRFANRKGQTPSTFGGAALNRIGNQNSGFRKNNPLGSNITGSVD